MEAWQVVLGAVTVVVGMMCFVLAFQAAEINRMKKLRDEDQMENQRNFYKLARSIEDVATEIGMVWVEPDRPRYKKVQ
jgi:hypothetical protein